MLNLTTRPAYKIHLNKLLNYLKMEEISVILYKTVTRLPLILKFQKHNVE